MNEKLLEATAKYHNDPSVENLIWYARRLAYAGDLENAIEVLSEGIEKYPEDPRLYRHRGHRFISTRRFQDAIDDFEKAKLLIKNVPNEIEEDGLPNNLNIPLSTLYFNIYYHLGLAYYLINEFKKAKLNFKLCLEVSENDDSIAASQYWLFLTQNLIAMQSNKKYPLPIRVKPDMTIIENFAYHKLIEIFSINMHDAEGLDELIAEDDLTLLYGLAMWLLFNGERDRTIEILTKILNSEQTYAFGYIAAEVEMKRVTSKK
ncbi:MAG: hypothetical protein INQ03_15195 [Candidatus Heimdallarchaeota archaeon]|nr:hypothetical protein [Candidatus Heimdallarchaeota archaeon]